MTTTTTQDYASTAITPDPDAAAVDADDHGLGLLNPALSGVYSLPFAVSSGSTFCAMVPFSPTDTLTQSGLPAGCEVVPGADGVPHTDYSLSTLGFGGGDGADDYGAHGFYAGSDPLRRGAIGGGRQQTGQRRFTCRSYGVEKPVR